MYECRNSVFFTYLLNTRGDVGSLAKADRIYEAYYFTSRFEYLIKAKVLKAFSTI